MWLNSTRKLFKKSRVTFVQNKKTGAPSEYDSYFQKKYNLSVTKTISLRKTVAISKGNQQISVGRYAYLPLTCV